MNVTVGAFMAISMLKDLDSEGDLSDNVQNYLSKNIKWEEQSQFIL